MMTDPYQLMLLPQAAIDRAKGRKSLGRQGHAADPGSGPEGETCRTCRHLTRIRHSRMYLKCELMRKHWTGGKGSDVRSGDPACREWERDT